MATTVAASGQASIERTARPRASAVPVREILEIESKAGGRTGAYGMRAAAMMDDVNAWLGGTDILEAGERELFGQAIGAFYRCGANYGKGRLLTESLRDGEFNCYSASVLLADVLTRMGKPVSAVLVPGHVLLAGDEYLFGIGPVPTAPFPREELSSRYARHRENDIGTGLLYLAHCWTGIRLCDQGRNDDALASFDNAIGLDPDDAELWNKKGRLLYAMGRLEDAIGAYDRAIGAGQFSAIVWYNKADVLEAMGRFGEADACLEKAAELDNWNRPVLTDLCRSN